LRISGIRIEEFVPLPADFVDLRRTGRFGILMRYSTGVESPVRSRLEVWLIESRLAVESGSA